MIEVQRLRKGDRLIVPTFSHFAAPPPDAPPEPVAMWNGYQWVGARWKEGKWQPSPGITDEVIVLEYPQTTVPGSDEPLCEWIED